MNKNVNVNNIRKITLELLRSYEEENRYVNLLLSSPKLKRLTSEELSSVTALLYTTVEKKLFYDYLISAFSGRSLSDIEPYVREVLRLGLCQILDMKSIPPFAAVNETVKLARHKGEAGFINAVLRRAVKDKDNLPLPKREKDIYRYLGILYSVPKDTVRFFASLLGIEECEELLSSFSKESGLSLTVNEKKTCRDELLSKLECHGAKASRYVDNGIIIEKGISPRSLPGFFEGEFFVQDEASRIAAYTLGIKDGDKVIDVCAAPGGKTFLAASKGAGEVFSFDLHESKLSLISDSAKRLGFDNITVRAVDATEGDKSLFGTADKVICDVPCSGLGVFGKKPDIRYKDISTAEELVPLQYKILCKSVSYLKPGGVIVYSTCTLNPSENEGVTDRFIKEHDDFEYEVFSLTDADFMGAKLTLLPHKHGTDGFYIAKIRRKA